MGLANCMQAVHQESTNNFFLKRDLLREGKNCEPAAKIGVARLNSFPQKRRREEVEEAQQESVNGPPLDVFI